MSLKKVKKLVAGITLCSVFFTLGLTSILQKTTKAETVDKSVKRNVMYYGDWSIWGGQGNFYPKDIPADKLTHLNYAFIYFDKDGNLQFTDKDAAIGAPVGMPGVQWGDSNAGCLNAFQDLRAKNPNLKIGISVGGWSKSETFSLVCRDDAKRANLVKNLVKFVKYTNMDFVDIDWEYPCSVRQPDKVDNENDDGTPHSIPEDKDNFVKLLKELRAELDKQGVEVGKKYELTVAIPASKAAVDQGIDVKGVFSVVDFANIMTYDMRGAWDTSSGHQTGLYTNPNDPLKGYGLSVDESVKYYISKGAPSNKIVVGAAYYSRGWGKVSSGPSTQNPGLFGNAEICSKDANLDPSRGALNEAPLKVGDGGRCGGVWSYRSLAALKQSNPGLKEYWDDTAKAPYLYDEKTGAFYTFDNPKSIGEKAKYVNANDLGGIIAWMAGQDKPTTSTKRDELTNASKEGLFGTTELPKYEIVNSNLNIECTVTPYTETGVAGGGYEITIKNNEKLVEQGIVMQGVEKSGKSVKTPKLYIKTNEDLTAGDYLAGSVKKENGYIIVDISGVYEGKLITPGNSYKLRLKATAAPSDTKKIEKIDLAQSIYKDGTEIGRQKIFGNSVSPDENEAPMINGVSDKSIIVGTTFDPMNGVTATDREDGDLTKNIKVTGSVDTNKVGSYTLTYSVGDSKNLITTVKRVITVNDKIVDKVDPWSRTTAQTKGYAPGVKVSHKGKIWQQVATSTSWYGEPGIASEWKSIGDDPNYVEKIEPWSVSVQNSQGYAPGTKVTHNGKTYIQAASSTVWYGEPGTPSGANYWKEL